MLKYIIFDIGNVLIRFTWKDYIQTLLQDEEAIFHVEKAIWSSGLWNELDRGVLAEEEILNRMLNYDARYQSQVALALSNIGECIQKTDYTLPWLQELKKAGYGIYYLSNNSQYAQNCSKDCLDFMAYMDGGIFSYEVKHVKPYKTIYKRLCEKYSLEPCQCVFIDDKQQNVATARALGMEAILFTSYEEARALLNKRLKPGGS